MVSTNLSDKCAGFPVLHNKCHGVFCQLNAFNVNSEAVINDINIRCETMKTTIQRSHY